MRKRKPVNVVDVGRTSAVRNTSLYAIKPTQERNSMNAVNMGKLSVSVHNRSHIKAFTEAAIPMNIMNVRMSAEKISSFYTREVMNVQDRNPVGVMTVGKLLV